MRARWAKSNALADALYVPMLMADMAGQLMVHAYEAGQYSVPKPAQMVFTLAIGDGQDAAAFLNKPWDEALAYFRARGVISENELSRLLLDYADKSKEARRALLETVQKRVYAMLDDAIAQGQTFQEFASVLRSEAQGLGISAEDPSYIQTVFRTNVLSAYGAGRHAALSHPDVVAARPYRQIRTAGDARVGDDHVELDGLVYLADGPLAGLKTPFRYNCRCSIVSLDEWDGEVVEALPAGAVQPGFG